MRVVLCQEVTVIDIFFVLSQVRCVFYTPLRRYTNQTCMAIFESTYGVSKIKFELLCFSCARVYLGRLFRQRQRVLKNSKTLHHRTVSRFVFAYGRRVQPTRKLIVAMSLV
jgi:hypothetical protein